MKVIELTQNQYTIVDTIDYNYLVQWKWSIRKRNGKYYAVRLGAGPRKYLMMHRVIAERAGFKGNIRHYDGDTLNNSRSNFM